jgi:hypothetical protein
MIKSRRMRCAGQISGIGKKRNAHRIMVGKPEETRPLGRPRHRYDNTRIKTDIKEIMWDGMDWILLAQDRDQ